jgi:hypothetical protein
MEHPEQHNPLPNPLNVLCSFGIPITDTQSIVERVMVLMSSQTNVDLKSIEELTSNITSLYKGLPCLGDAFVTIAKESSNRSETETVVWLLCALMCMHPYAKHCIHDILLNFGFKEIAEVLFFNSTCLLSDALGRVTPEMFETIMQLIFAFLTHYPNAYDAHMSNRLLCANI